MIQPEYNPAERDWAIDINIKSMQIVDQINGGVTNQYSLWNTGTTTIDALNCGTLYYVFNTNEPTQETKWGAGTLDSYDMVFRVYKNNVVDFEIVDKISNGDITNHQFAGDYPSGWPYPVKIEAGNTYKIVLEAIPYDVDGNVIPYTQP